MTDEAETTSAEFDRSILAWLEEDIGARLLAYLLGNDLDSIPSLISGETQLSAEQAAILAELAQFRDQIPDNLGDTSVKDVVSFVLTRLDQVRRDPRQNFAERAVGAEQIPAGQDDLERTLEPDEYPLCQEALDVAVRAVKVLAVDRLDILALPDGARRSATFLLGA
ncbi:hypothetical protein [Actinocrispum wychmicini]|uniref:hypothetical protein n=1 Tax=Actinocrispum wychmicini TaxID=1213861 RepID=UPI00104771D3|nr:hypothetical protein [Actinocrispum wychmicini]